MMLHFAKCRDEEGQEIALFGVLLAMVVVVGSVLALNLVWLRAEWTALQEAAISAAAGGTLEVQGLPGARRLDPDRAEKAARRLLADNRLFRDPHTAADAYAAAWALNYYLIKYRPDQYASYLKTLAEKRPLLEDDPQTRLDEFRQHFGDPDELERDFLKQMARAK